MAKKYFGSEDAMGKTLQINSEMKNNHLPYAASPTPAPEESSVKYDFLIPYSNETLLFNPEDVAQLGQCVQ